MIITLKGADFSTNNIGKMDGSASETQYIDLGLTKSAYWFNMSTNPAGNTEMVTMSNYGSQASPKNFWATKKFTRETLPIGSQIILANGWQYRAEWWNANNDPVNSQGERGPVVNTAGTVTVTEEWWGGMTTRAFNIYTNPSTDISGYTEAQINEAFKIVKGA